MPPLVVAMRPCASVLDVRTYTEPLARNHLETAIERLEHFTMDLDRSPAELDRYLSCVVTRMVRASLVHIPVSPFLSVSILLQTTWLALRESSPGFDRYIIQVDSALAEIEADRDAVRRKFADTAMSLRNQQRLRLISASYHQLRYELALLCDASVAGIREGGPMASYVARVDDMRTRHELEIQQLESEFRSISEVEEAFGKAVRRL